jgi:guanine deaminase
MRRYLRGRMLHCRDVSGADNFGVEYLSDGILIVEGERIVALLPAAAALQQGVRAEECQLLGKRLLVPGFIDTHIHAYQLDVLASYGEQLLQWLTRYTFPAEAKMADPVVAAEVAELFLQQLLRNGTTSALVFATTHKTATDVLFSAAAKHNFCLITGKVLMDRNAPPGLLDTAESAYSDSLALIEKWHKQQRLHYALTPRFALTSTAAQLQAAQQVLQRHPDLYLQTHLAENSDEVAAVRQLFADCKNYLDVYDRYGLCTDKSVFAHCLHLEAAEISRLRATGAVISCCPTSNLFLGSGLFDWQGMKAAGVKLSLGTDVGGGTSYSMLATLRELYKVAQLTQSTFSPLEGFYTITLGNARALQLQARIGNLAAGSDADFVIIDPEADALINRRVLAARDIAEEWFVYMTLGDDRVISETWVAGHPLYRNDRCLLKGVAA